MSIETATQVCSVAVHNEDELVAAQSLHIERSHSEKLADMLDNIIQSANKSIADLDAVAVSEGPGSYTGLRIGASLAKGICYAANKPLISIDTLKAMASSVNQYNNRGALLCPMIDARRSEVYCAVFDSHLNNIKATKPMVLESNSFQELLEENEMWFFGDGSHKAKDILTENGNSNFIENVEPTAKVIGELANQKFAKSEFVDLAYFEPFYLKDFHVTKPRKEKQI
ncbi:MAG: tRNA (adenosine(37)-N6)-threonylcarbamoyltransferase complex dimerization subunit type 1 TsaB [Bacteroidota bacterium]